MYLFNKNTRNLRNSGSVRFPYIITGTIIILLLIFSFFTFSGCESKEKVIKIGNQVVLSGDDNFFGEDQQISLELAASELSPVKIGGFDYKIDIITKDDEGKAEKAFLIAQEFVEENVASVIGPIFNGTVKASIPVYAEYNIPVISPSAQGEDIASGYNNFFRMVMNNTQKIENIANFLSGTVNAEKLVVIDNGEEYSIKLVDYLLEIFDSQKIPYLKRYSIPFDSSEYDILAENLVIDEPDSIFFCANYNELADLIERARKLGLKSQFITEEKGMDEGISSITDKLNLEGIIAVIPEPPSIAIYSEDKKSVEFWRKYGDFRDKMEKQDLTSGGPGPFAPYSYDALYLLIDAMKKSNSILPGDFLEALKSTSYDGIVGKVEFNSNGDRIDPQSTVFIMKNGDWVRFQG